MRKFLITCSALLALSGFAQATEVNITTNKGDIRVELYDEVVPNTVANFLRYVDEGFYEGTIFHRVIRGFMIQGGGFDSNLGRKDVHQPIAYEGYNSPANNRGTLAMARTQAPDSATSQFFINHVDNPFLNHGARGGAGYTTFGHVISGLDVVDSIAGVAVRNVGPYQNVPSEPVVIESITRVN